MYDYHIHSYHSADGRQSLREIALGAIHNGLDEICITAHYDYDFPLAPHLNFLCDLIDYVEDVERYAARFADQLIIKTGVEIGMQAGRDDVFAATRQAMAGLRFDYILGSIHWMGFADGNPRHLIEPEVNPVFGYGATPDEVMQKYALQLLSCAKDFPELDCIGHLTYYARQNPYPDRQLRYRNAPDELDALFMYLISHGKGLEINTSSKTPFGFFMPDEDIMCRYHELGGEIVTIGSDAHTPDRIGEHYAAACQMLRRAGMRYVCTYENHHPIFHRIGG